MNIFLVVLMHKLHIHMYNLPLLAVTLQPHRVPTLHLAYFLLQERSLAKFLVAFQCSVRN